MKINHRQFNRRQFIFTIVISALLVLSGAVSLLRADSGTCNGATVTLPFTDLTGNAFFCQIAEAYFSGLMNGTSATSFTPSGNVSREQMAALVTRTLDQSLLRGSRRAALNQLYTTQSLSDCQSIDIGFAPVGVAYDGKDVWVASHGNESVWRVRASDGAVVGAWTQATAAYGIVAARGKVYTTGLTQPSSLYEVDPTQPSGQVTVLSNDLGGDFARGIAFDGSRLWVANSGYEANLSGQSNLAIIDLSGNLSITNVANGLTHPTGILYDGANIWVTDTADKKIKQLDSQGNILKAVTVGKGPNYPVYDGQNLWVPNTGSNSVSVVQAATGKVLATLTGNGLNKPFAAAFDGERILVTNIDGDSVSLWRATDLTPIGAFGPGTLTGNLTLAGACSDGLHFFVARYGSYRLLRF